MLNFKEIEEIYLYLRDEHNNIEIINIISNYLKIKEYISKFKYYNKKSRDTDELIFLKGMFCVLFNENNFSKIFDKKKDDKMVARILFSKILKELDYPLKNIAIDLRRDHSTIVYYLKKFDIMIELNAKLRKNYLMSRKLLNLRTKFVV